MRSFDRSAPLGPHQPVEAVAHAEVRAGALPVLDDPREAGLRERRPDRSCRDLVGRDGCTAAVSFAICGAGGAVEGKPSPASSAGRRMGLCGATDGFVRSDGDEGTAISFRRRVALRSLAPTPRRPVLDTGLG